MVYASSPLSSFSLSSLDPGINFYQLYKNFPLKGWIVKQFFSFGFLLFHHTCSIISQCWQPLHLKELPLLPLLPCVLLSFWRSIPRLWKNGWFLCACDYSRKGGKMKRCPGAFLDPSESRRSPCGSRRLPKNCCLSEPLGLQCKLASICLECCWDF